VELIECILIKLLFLLLNILDKRCIWFTFCK